MTLAADLLRAVDPVALTGLLPPPVASGHAER